MDLDASDVLQQAPFVVLRIDADARILDWNDEAGALLGLDPARDRGRTLAERVPVEGGDVAWRGLLGEARGARRTWTTRCDDRTFTCTWLVQPLRDPTGAPAGAMLYGRDVNVETETERRIHLERTALRAILDNLALSVWIIDPKGDYLFAEGKGLAHFGLTPEMLAGGNILTAFPDNPATETIRAGLSGQHAHYPSVEAGCDFENWQIPVRARGGEVTALVGVTLNVTETRRNERELQTRLEQIERQQQAIRELSTPIIEVWDHVLTLPIIGLVDSVRTAEIMDSLLQAVARSRARFAILDMTGVDVVDTGTASHLLGLIRAIRLLGAEGILTGIHPNIAQTVVALGVDLSGLVVRSTLREALRYCIAQMQPGR
ncbi:PAS domain-containing protein [Nannocystis pusilla]|uniref:PAS domain-containing protein n=1 Tax=Nannocystis pusilla TaxID=889268 RepID=UPI003DA69C5F